MKSVEEGMKCMMSWGNSKHPERGCQMTDGIRIGGEIATDKTEAAMNVENQVTSNDMHFAEQEA